MNFNLIRKNPRLLRMARWIRRVLGRSWMRLAHARGAKKNAVFFSSFHGKSYSDSPKRISEALHALNPETEIVWQLADAQGAPEYVRVVRPHSLKALSEIARARCIVDNFNRPVHFLKFSDQLYVQTWHGDRGFKKILYDLDDGLEYPDGAQMDLAVSGSDFGTRLYRTAFRYSGEVMQLGMPRNDALVHPDPAHIRAVRAALGISEREKVMLYAPTFRDATIGESQRADFDIRRAADTLAQSTHEKWRVLVRAHDLNRGVASDSVCMDVTEYPEMNDLLLITDLLITDYSSSAGDFVLLNRPVILFQKDLDGFMASDREMYFDLRTCPYTRAESEAALLHWLEHFSEIPADGRAVREFYGTTETGCSAQAVAEWISKKIQRADRKCGSAHG